MSQKCELLRRRHLLHHEATKESRHHLVVIHFPNPTNILIRPNYDTRSKVWVDAVISVRLPMLRLPMPFVVRFLIAVDFPVVPSYGTVVRMECLG